MALARVVEFEGVDSARMAQLKSRIEGDGRPEDVPATEILVLHDPERERAVTILFFENDDDYRRAHETLDAMPAEDTPGDRTSVTRYDVALRMNG